jgi:hypothetical protein
MVIHFLEEKMILLGFPSMQCNVYKYTISSNYYFSKRQKLSGVKGLRSYVLQ